MHAEASYAAPRDITAQENGGGYNSRRGGFKHCCILLHKYTIKQKTEAGEKKRKTNEGAEKKLR
jgi:hypothetical protein